MSLYATKPIRWNVEKDEWLQTERNISFAMVLSIVRGGGEGNLLDIIEHPNQDKYPSQRAFVV